MITSNKQKMKGVTDRLLISIFPLNNAVVDVMINIFATFEIYGLCDIHSYPSSNLTSINDLKVFMTVGRFADTKDCGLQGLKSIKYQVIDQK